MGLDGLDEYYTDYPHTRRGTGRGKDKFSLRALPAVMAMAAMQAVDMLGTAFLASLGTEINAGILVPAGKSRRICSGQGRDAAARDCAVSLVVQLWNRLLKKSGSWALLVFVAFSAQPGAAGVVFHLCGKSRRTYGTIIML
jgi:hypothetical protein